MMTANMATAARPTSGLDLAQRVDTLDWSRIETELDQYGAATTGQLLTAAECVENFVENSQHAAAGRPFGFGAEKILLGDHFENRPDILGHAAVNEHQAFLEPTARFG